MATIPIGEAAEKLAQGVEKVSPASLLEIHSDFFPDLTAPDSALASEIAGRIRSGIEPEEMVDLWNIVLPGARHVWFNEATDEIHYNEQWLEYTD
jgi:hypothetical protein